MRHDETWDMDDVESVLFPTARDSFEWETETLLNHSGIGLDLDKALYTCPFRKRNPVRFNIRDHGACASAPFSSISALR